MAHVDTFCLEQYFSCVVYRQGELRSWVCSLLTEIMKSSLLPVFFFNRSHRVLFFQAIVSEIASTSFCAKLKSKTEQNKCYKLIRGVEAASDLHSFKWINNQLHKQCYLSLSVCPSCLCSVYECFYTKQSSMLETGLVTHSSLQWAILEKKF